MTPTFSALFPQAFPVLILELLFGIGFNELVKWAQEHKLWHVSISVVAGVAGTLIIPIFFMHKSTMELWQVTLFYFLCFTASGVPMIVGSTRKTVNDNHRRRPLPNAAIKVRDEAVMNISAILDQIANGGVEVVKVVHELHEIKGKLKSL